MYSGRTFSPTNTRWTALRARFARVDQHVYTGRVWILETGGPNRVDDPLEVLAIHGNVDIAGRAGSERVALVNVQEHGDATDDSIFDAGPCQRASDPVDRVEELSHVAIVGGNGRHRTRP